jgi:hypothetical protein
VGETQATFFLMIKNKKSNSSFISLNNSSFPRRKTYENNKTRKVRFYRGEEKKLYDK